jgi:hypothetical protein
MTTVPTRWKPPFERTTPQPAYLRTHNTPTSLPVFTISDADRILHGHDYADRVVETLYDYLLRIGTLHGTGRLFLP